MTRKYLNEIENLYQIKDLIEADEYLEYDEEDEAYFTDNEEFYWWEELADAMQYLDDKCVAPKVGCMVDLEDYITIAKGIGFRG